MRTVLILVGGIAVAGLFGAAVGVITNRIIEGSWKVS